MSFPFHDRCWRDALDFLERHRRPGESILAPDIFWWRFERIHRYANTRLRPGQGYDWAVIHKGEIGALAEPFARALPQTMRAVWANEVFVIWARGAALPALDPALDHVKAFHAALARANFAASADAAGRDHVLPDAGAIAKFEALDDRALRRAMDDFYRAGGYKYETLRDRTMYADLSRAVAQALAQAAGGDILDVGCGDGRVGALAPPCRGFLGIDISEVAVAAARARAAPRHRYAVMDAHAPALPDAAFDAVAFVEAIEHVRRPPDVLGEIARVLRPGGLLVVNAANRNSLHLVVNARLGYPPFKTNYQHFSEFTAEELGALLAAAGFRVEEMRGIHLYPYWGVPGLDGPVRAATDDDPVLVETLRDLGRRAGPEHAFMIFAVARKEG